MLLAIVGITGIGKSFFVEKISEKLDFKKVHTIRTRLPRKGESNKYFMSEEELENMDKEGKIAYRIKLFGGQYGYLKEEIFSEDNMIFEMHYTNIFDWKKIRKDIKTIYILPKDINIAKEKIKERSLPRAKEIERLDEIEEHYNRIMTDEELRKNFDYIVYNNYDKESEDRILDLVKSLLAKEKSI